MMERRTFLGAMATGLFVAPLAAWAQRGDPRYRVGLLINYPHNPDALGWKTFVETMHGLGHVVGRNLQIEVRSANYHAERLPALASELVRLNVDLIVTGGDGEVRAAKQATTTIPIVMAPSGDPVGAGYIVSYAKPGGNITGLTWESPDLSAKLVQLLKDAVPYASRLAVLWNATNPVKALDFERTRLAATALGFTVSSIELTASGNLEAAFTATVRAHPDTLLILTDEVLNYPRYARIVAFAMQQHLPSILGAPSYAAAGGLIGYGPSGTEFWRRVAIYVDKILKGAKPGDLPVERPDKFELVLNLKTAKALGLTIPPLLLQRADQVIE